MRRHAPYVIMILFLATFIDWNLILMRVFRNVARVKARNRRIENHLAVVTWPSSSDVATMLDLDTPIEVDTLSTEGITFTREELAEYDGSRKDFPIYVALKGRVYDVSEGPYGPGEKYHKLAGKDATFPLATGCLKKICLEAKTPLTARQEIDVKRWVEFFEFHDKYVHVGMISSGNLVP